MSHHCHATGCEVSTQPEIFMCLKHWRALPKPMRDRIWATYRPGQCDDWNITKDYADAARESIRFLAAKEGVEPDTSIYDMLEPATPENTPP
jgi:hypothetical protein